MNETEKRRKRAMKAANKKCVTRNPTRELAVKTARAHGGAIPPPATSVFVSTVTSCMER